MTLHVVKEELELFLFFYHQIVDTSLHNRPMTNFYREIC